MMIDKNNVELDPDNYFSVIKTINSIHSKMLALRLTFPDGNVIELDQFKRLNTPKKAEVVKAESAKISAFVSDLNKDVALLEQVLLSTANTSLSAIVAMLLSDCEACIGMLTLRPSLTNYSLH